MTVPTVLLIAAVACVACATVSVVLISVDLDRRGLRTPLPLLRALVFRNLDRYRTATRAETGKTGILFYAFVIPINLALLFALAALLMWTIR
jgi:hypothetical protein